MLNPFDTLELNNLFVRKKDNDKILLKRESNYIEFKENFNWNSKSKYAKTMAAYANRDGGYIIFGIKDSPHEILGLNSSNFESLDEEKVTSYLNEVFSPEINWSKLQVEVDEKKIGIIYTYQSKNKPIICTKNDDVIKEAEIYYRYRGRTEKIKYPEFIELLNKKIENERKLWMNHLEKISKIGVENVGLLDIREGRIEGPAGTLYIDEKLLKELEFIKEGEFQEKKGTKTLKLIGEIREIVGSSVLPYRTTFKGIHTREVYQAVLYGKLHENVDAVEYLKQLVHENSMKMPFYFFMKKAEINKVDVKKIFESVQTTKKSQKGKLIARLEHDTYGYSSAYIDEKVVKSAIVFSNTEDFKAYLSKKGNTTSNRISLIYNLLVSENNTNIQNYIEEFGKDILLAISQLSIDQLTNNQEFIADLMMDIYDNSYIDLASNYREVICFIDRRLYA